MRRARFRLRINQEVREADIVVGTKAQWESSNLASTSGWSINVQGGQIVATRLVGGGKSYVPLSFLVMFLITHGIHNGFQIYHQNSRNYFLENSRILVVFCQ